MKTGVNEVQKTGDDIAELWMRTCNDDRQAFELLHDLLNKLLVNSAMLVVQQIEIAEEVVSDVFLKCWLKRKSLADVQNIQGYFFVAVRNQSLNHIKKKSFIPLTIEYSHVITFTNADDPHQALERKELFVKIDDAISGLPLQCKLAFRLVKEDGMRLKEVGDMLNISSRTVQTQVYRAMKKLRVSLVGYN